MLFGDRLVQSELRVFELCTPCLRHVVVFVCLCGPRFFPDPLRASASKEADTFLSLGFVASCLGGAASVPFAPNLEETVYSFPLDAAPCVGSVISSAPAQFSRAAGLRADTWLELGERVLPSAELRLHNRK